MGCKFVEQLARLRKLSAESVDNTNAFDEFKEYFDLITGKADGADYKEFISPVFIMNAISRAILSEKEEKINEINI